LTLTSVSDNSTKLTRATSTDQIPVSLRSAPYLSAVHYARKQQKKNKDKSTSPRLEKKEGKKEEGEEKIEKKTRMGSKYSPRLEKKDKKKVERSPLLQKQENDQPLFPGLKL